VATLQHSNSRTCEDWDAECNKMCGLMSVMSVFVIRTRSICPRCTAAYRLIVRPGFRCSYFRHQVPPCPYDVRDPSSERWNCAWECWPVILPKCQLPRYIYGSFTCCKSATWDRRFYFPSEGRCIEDFFFALKNPDSFGQIWTRKLGYLKAARYP